MCLFLVNWGSAGLQKLNKFVAGLLKDLDLLMHIK